MATLGELYDSEALARIDAGPTHRPGPPSGVNHRGAALALVGAIGLGLQEVFDPEPPQPVIEEVDQSARREHERIRIVGMELGPRFTTAYVAV